MKKHTPVHRPVRTLTALVTGLLSAGSVLAASPYGSTTFFGDSLTDNGFFDGILGQQPARTTNPDKVWAAHLAERLGTSADPAARLTWSGVVQTEGTNHAVSGARVQRQDGYPMPLLAGFITPVKRQVDRVLAQPEPLSRDGLYAVWAGANDILAYTNEASAALADPSTQADAARRVVTKSAAQATEVVDLVHRLHDAGAGTVLLLNLPDMGSTPLARDTGSQALLSAASRQFNTALVARMGPVKKDLVMLNVQDMLAEVTAAPNRFGLRNVTSPACTSSGLTGSIDAGTCTPNTLVEPDAASTYLFADTLHPTGAGHALLADYAASVLRAPAQMSLLTQAPLGGSALVFRSLDARMRAGATLSGTRAYAMFTRVNEGLQEGSVWRPGYHNGINALTVGVDHNIGNHVLIGTALTHARHHASLGASAGRFALGQTLASVYGQYRIGGWRAGLDATAGHLEVDRVERSVRIGPARLKEKADTQGSHIALRASTGYAIELGAFTLTPLASLSAQRVSVSGFSEARSGGTATSLSYESQTRHVLTSRVGLNAQTVLNLAGTWIEPYAEVFWEREHRRDDQKVSANVREMAGQFSRAGYRLDPRTTTAAAGVQIAWKNGVQTQLGYAGRYADRLRSHSVQAGLTYAF